MLGRTVLTQTELKKLAYRRAAEWLQQSIDSKCGIINPALSWGDGPRDHRGDHPQEAEAEASMREIITELLDQGR